MRCDLCGGDSTILYPMCTRRGCQTTKHVCVDCLEEAALKYIVVTDGSLLVEVRDTLRDALNYLRREGTKPLGKEIFR